MTGIAAAMPLPNIDTDTITPIDYCINRQRPNFDVALFRRWRYRADGSEDPTFLLNRRAYRATQVLVAGANFGCGSSREMAVWALLDFGIACVIAPSFGEIFYNNSFHNGLLAAVVSTPDADRLAAYVTAAEGCELTVDLASKTVVCENLDTISFALDDLRCEMLQSGLDPIAVTFTRNADIDAFEARDRASRPWAQTPGARAGAT